jgi:hypothetical protein
MARLTEFHRQHYPSDLLGFDPGTYDGMVLYYRLMTKVDWFRG